MCVDSRGRAILDGFEARAEQIADEIADATATEVVAFGAMRDPALRAEVRQLSRQHIDAFLAAARAHGTPSEQMMAAVRGRAAVRARQMVPLAALLHSYLIAQRVISAAITREAGTDSGSRGAALALNSLTFDYTIAVTTAMADAYVETVQGDLVELEAARLAVVDALLTDLSDDERPELARRAVGLGFDPDHRYVVVVVPGDQQAETRRWLARAAGRSERTAFVVGRGADLIALFDADGPYRAEQAATQAGAPRAGVGTPFAGTAGFRTSFHEARRAARHTTPGRPFVFAPHDIRLFDELTTTAGDRAAELIPPATRKALGDVTLRATLHAYVDADLNVPATARAMSLHPNSVRYRLRRIAELSGRDPQKLGDLLELITAARLLDRAG